jgi:hypothetical protein
VSTNETDSKDFETWISDHKKLLIVGGAIILALLFIYLLIVKPYYSTTNKGEEYEQKLEALHSFSVQSLGTCIDQGAVSADVAEEEFAKIKGILVEAAGARYQNNSTAQDAIGGGTLFSAVSEAYPQLDQSSWRNLQTTVVGCREEFQGTQDRIQATAADFETWQTNDSLFSGWVKDNFPNDALEITDPSTGTVLTGEPAYQYLTAVVTVQSAKTAFGDGTVEQQDLFSSESPSPEKQ